MEKQLLMEKFKDLTLAQMEHAMNYNGDPNMIESIRDNMIFILRFDEYFLSAKSRETTEPKHIDKFHGVARFINRQKLISKLRSWWLMWKTDEDFGWMTDILVPCIVAAITTLIVSRLISH